MPTLLAHLVHQQHRGLLPRRRMAEPFLQQGGGVVGRGFLTRQLLQRNRNFLFT